MESDNVGGDRTGWDMMGMGNGNRSACCHCYCLGITCRYSTTILDGLCKAVLLVLTLRCHLRSEEIGDLDVIELQPLS
jgi:hypothetical protein